MSRKQTAYEVTWILPKDTSELESKFAEVMAEIISKKLNAAELEEYIRRLESMEAEEL